MSSTALIFMPSICARTATICNTNTASAVRRDDKRMVTVGRLKRESITYYRKMGKTLTRSDHKR